jgi:hypothetical protein
MWSESVFVVSDWKQLTHYLNTYCMNRKIVLNVLRKLFPSGTDKVVMNLVDKKISYTNKGETTTSDLDEKAFGENLSMLKDFLNIRGNIIQVDLDLKEKTMFIKHTEGTTKL